MEIRQSEKAKKRCREMCPPCPQPSPSSRAGEGLAALLFLLGLPHCLSPPPPPGMLGSPGAAGGAALRTDGGTSQLSPHGVLCALKPRPAQGVVLCELVDWPPADLSAFLFSERDWSRVYLLCCWLAPARKGTASRGVGGKARRALQPRMGQESQTSFPSKVLGFDSQEVMLNHMDGVDEVPNLHLYRLLFRCKMKYKLAKQLKQVARLQTVP